MLASSGDSDKDSWVKTAKLGTLFFLWYALNIAYNITNKKVLNAVPLPWIQSTLSLWMGVPLVLFMWLTGVRKAPVLSSAEIGKMVPIAFMHALGHLAAVVSFAWGAVSFTQIVKAAEPVFTAGLSGIFLNQVFHPAVYAALVPVIGGVAIASLGELSFSAMAFMGAMISNITFAFRAILSKKILGGKNFGQNMNASNIYAVMTIIAAILSTPLAIWKEGAIFSSAIETAAASGVSSAYIYKNMILSGLCFFLYNEVAFQALDQVNAVTHAVANTIKRVAIILASVIIFGTPLTPIGILGSSVAISGVLLYSLLKNKYPRTDYGKKEDVPAPAATA
jgi:solute carrier family 35 protein E1